MTDAELLKEIFHYDPDTGEWTWKTVTAGGFGGSKMKVGDPAGTIDQRDGSRMLRFNGKVYRSSRLAWLYMYGEWPDRQVLYIDPNLPIPSRDAIKNLRLSGKQVDLTQEELKQLIHYDPKTGIFTWIVSKKGIVKGERAGRLGDTGHRGKYWYIVINRTEQLGHRLAWLYTYGRWPEARIIFRDGDPSNCKLENLVEGEFEHGTRQNPELTEEDRRRRRSATFRKHDLKRHFGLTPAAKQQMIDAQGGVCAICKQPERSMANHGRSLKEMAVDHDHITGAIRGVLCNDCNRMLGGARDRIDLLEEGIAYLRRHASQEHAV